MTKILIPIDGSEASMRALDYVVRRKRRGEAVQAFILNVQMAISPRGGLVTRSMIRDYQDQMSEEILEKPEIRAKVRYLQADTYMEVGEPSAAILKFARRIKCDEIVIGNRGLGGLKGMLMGSIAYKVIQGSAVPVIVVR
jgi:nucleotide-binding universal stress UspA family protein